MVRQKRTAAERIHFVEDEVAHVTDSLPTQVTPKERIAFPFAAEPPFVPRTRHRIVEHACRAREAQFTPVQGLLVSVVLRQSSGMSAKLAHEFFQTRARLRAC